MNRVFAIARMEFLAIVRSKTFIIGVLMVPVLFGATMAFQTFAEGRSDTSSRRVGVIDRTGVLYDALVAAAEAHNLDATRTGVRTGPEYVLERIPAGIDGPGDLELALSERVRARDLFSFIDIPATMTDADRTAEDELHYYTETPSYLALPQWLQSTIEREATLRRFETSVVAPELVDRLSRPSTLTTLGLLSRSADGTVAVAQRVSPLRTFAVPFVAMTLLFFALMSATPLLLTAVVEEKMSRISEVLIASVSPTHLMAGKLAGVSAVSFLLALIYVVAGIYLMVVSGEAGLISVPLLLWFAVFLLAAVLMFGSIFIAIGAACSDLKDSQNLMQPVVVFLSLPLLAAPVIIRSPESTLSVVLSMFPTFTPFLMLARLALTPAPPLWQVLVSLVLTALTAAGLIWAAGRIFRVGLLMHGKPPNLPELLRWIRQ